MKQFNFLRDESGIVVGWLIKILLMLAIAGLIVLEGGSLLWVRYTVSSAAQGAAQEGALDIKTKGQLANPEVAIREYIKEKDVELVTFSIDTSARTVSVIVRKQAQTFVVKRIDALKKYTVATDSHSIYYGG
ncbi:MAG: hypothetical protein ACRDIU_07000 [Actinomycetota bacterium]